MGQSWTGSGLLLVGSKAEPDEPTSLGRFQAQLLWLYVDGTNLGPRRQASNAHQFAFGPAAAEHSRTRKNALPTTS